MGGNSSSIEYAVPVSEKKPGESAIYRNPLYKDKILDGPGDIKDMKRAILHTCTQHTKNNCLGAIVRK